MLRNVLCRLPELLDDFMKKISLIGLDLAREGLEFTFTSPLQICSECRVRNVCFSLEPGRAYKITKVREKEHPCIVFRGDKVKTIEVEEADETMNLKYGLSLQEGSTVTAKSINCDYLTCPNIEGCNILNGKEGRKATITSIGEKLDCPKGYDMRKVLVSFK